MPIMTILNKLRQDVFSYIELYYNIKRIYSALG